MEGDLRLDEKRSITVFAVSERALPPHTFALIGNKELKELSVSLDYAQAHPGCPFQIILENSHVPRLALFPLQALVFDSFASVLSGFLMLLPAFFWLSLSDSVPLAECTYWIKGLSLLFLSRMVWFAPGFIFPRRTMDPPPPLCCR